MYCKQRTCAILKSFRCNTYQKQGVGSLSHFESRSLPPDSEPNSILRQEGNVNGRGNFDNLPGGRQPARGGINPENDHIIRQLILRQQVIAARIDGKVTRLLPASRNVGDERQRSL